MRSLDDLLPAEFVASRKKKYELAELKEKKSTYWDFLGELMYFGGFEAVKAVLDDYLTPEQARTLLMGARRVHNGVIYDHANAALAGAAGVHKSKYFSQIMATYKKDMA